MLKTSNHAGVEGYIIKNIRNQVEFSLQVREKPTENIMLLNLNTNNSDPTSNMSLVLGTLMVYDLLILFEGV